MAKVKGTVDAELKKIERCPLLILDDLFLVPLDAKERPILLDIIVDRHGRKSMILTSQLPVSSWYDAIGDPTVADAILEESYTLPIRLSCLVRACERSRVVKANKPF